MLAKRSDVVVSYPRIDIKREYQRTQYCLIL